MLIVMGVLILFILVGFAALLLQEERNEQDAVSAEWGVSVVESESELSSESEAEPMVEWTRMEDVMEGDAVPDDYVVPDTTSEDEAVELFPSGDAATVKSKMIVLAEEYNEMIPYGYRGRSWSYGYFKQENGYKNTLYDSCENGFGLDGLGYVIWLYRNSIGHTPDELCGDFSVSRLEHPVAIDELQIGDICLTNDTDEDVDYGVVCGFVSGHAVVTMCDNIPNERFAYGCNHLSYIRSDWDQYLGNYRAADFMYFYRLEEMLSE